MHPLERYLREAVEGRYPWAIGSGVVAESDSSWSVLVSCSECESVLHGCLHCGGRPSRLHLPSAIDQRTVMTLQAGRRFSLPLSQKEVREKANSSAFVALDAITELGFDAELFALGFPFSNFPVMIRITVSYRMSYFFMPKLLIALVLRYRRGEVGA